MEWAEDSPKHETFRAEMCDMKLLGGIGACRYYLSRLLGEDQFQIWHTEFLENLSKFLDETAAGTSKYLPVNLMTVEHLAPYLKCEYLARMPDVPQQLTLRERAVVLRIRHPLWSDERIARQVPTTVKQLARNTDYRALSEVMKSERAKEVGDLQSASGMEDAIGTFDTRDL